MTKPDFEPHPAADASGPRPRRPRKGIYVLPNLFTLAALFGGFYAVVMAINGRFAEATIGIFAAMVLDSLDGRVARMTGTQSAFGEQMDSLADMVSFGAAPALIAYQWALQPLGKAGWFAAFVYCACAALRLARFNVNTGVVDKRYFQGLPSPAAAALVAGFIRLSAAVVDVHRDVPLFRQLVNALGGAARGARRLLLDDVRRDPVRRPHHGHQHPLLQLGDFGGRCSVPFAVLVAAALVPPRQHRACHAAVPDLGATRSPVTSFMASAGTRPACQHRQHLHR